MRYVSTVAAVAAVVLSTSCASAAEQKAKPEGDISHLVSIGAAVEFAGYTNLVRNWGIVTQIYPSGDPVNWIAFVTQHPDGTSFRWECDDPVAQGCDLIEYGDSILVNGHSESRQTQDFDGPTNFHVPNGVFRCPGTCAPTSGNECELLTE